MSTRIVTGEARFSFVHLLQPRESQYGGEAKYSVTVLVPKTDTATKARIDAAIEAAKEKGRVEKWNGVIPPVVATPVYDGDGVRPSDGQPFGDECKGHWVFTATSKVTEPPKIVDANINPIIDATEVYSGMYGRIAVNFAPYANAGKKGIGAYIATNIQKTRDGEPLGATDPSAESDFGAPISGAPVTGAPIGGAPTQPTQPSQQVNPLTGAPMQQAQMQQAQTQQPFAQPQQTFVGYDPITGAPIYQ